MLSIHNFLTIEECKGTRDIIYGLRESWTNRGLGFLPIFTLGTASYLDASQEDDTLYRQKAKIINPILASNFSYLYKHLIEVLTKLLNMPVSYTEELAYPGFHIFLASKLFEKPVASTHFDLQFKSIKWNYDTVDFDHPISFTCPIAIPTSGSGLNYWEITTKANSNLPLADIEEMKSTKEVFYLPYTLGKLVLHQGLTLHQIAPSTELLPDDERITLQGHGLICDGVMRLYW